MKTLKFFLRFVSFFGALVWTLALTVGSVSQAQTFTDANWTSLPGIGGSDGTPAVAAVTPNGNIYVAGSFTIIGFTFANHIAKWDGTNWSALGSGISPANTTYSSLACDSSGNVYVGGDFSTAGGVNVSNIANRTAGVWWWPGSGTASALQSLLSVAANFTR